MTTKEGISSTQLSSQLWLPLSGSPYLAPESTRTANQNRVFRLLACRTVVARGVVIKIEAAGRFSLIFSSLASAASTGSSDAFDKPLLSAIGGSNRPSAASERQ